MALLAIDLSLRKAEVLGARPKRNAPWVEQIAGNLTWEDRLLAVKTHLIHDRNPDPLFH